MLNWSEKWNVLDSLITWFWLSPAHFYNGGQSALVNLVSFIRKCLVISKRVNQKFRGGYEQSEPLKADWSGVVTWNQIELEVLLRFRIKLVESDESRYSVLANNFRKNIFQNPLCYTSWINVQTLDRVISSRGSKPRTRSIFASTVSDLELNICNVNCRIYLITLF